jgi:hypothetical protein
MGRSLLAISLALLAALAAEREASAQYSLTDHWSYDLGALRENDWQALGSNLIQQTFRGSLALVFPDGRAPITNPKLVERWVRRGAPLRAVAFPGITGDAAAAWALAKQVGIANQRSDGKPYPVLAVNSGWTDWFSALGTGFEYSTMRPAIDAGRACTAEPITARVAGLLRTRFERSTQKVGLVGHSAGGYYSANVAHLLPPEQQGNVLVYNLGLAANLPRRVKAVQLVGTRDTLAQVNSSAPALSARGTRVVDGLSHLGGELWRLGDSQSSRRWEVEPLAGLFPARDAQGVKAPRVEKLRGLAQALEARARSARQVADRNRAFTGARGVLSMKLDHDATMLRLAAERATALADLQSAREAKDTSGAAAASARLGENQRARQAAAQKLGQARGLLRNLGTDSLDFAGMLVSESLSTATNPLVAWQKAMNGSMAMMSLGTKTAQVMMHNPLFNPWAAFLGPSRSGPRSRGASRR